MKALTLLQPWAQLMADGRKHYETRGWYPWRLKAGDLVVITSSKTMSAADRDCAEACGYEPALLPLGAAVAVVRYLETHKTEHTPVSDEERSYGNYQPGRFAWRCEFVAKLEPIPCRGALNVWDVPADLERELLAQLDKAALP